mmetsp:Transcript_2219/g.3610  ORF Transcript_2219/g.3610 Transcript_2219/m.3610 type:complete len:183 (-) Transcript_2219:1851-2399(-)
MPTTQRTCFTIEISETSKTNKSNTTKEHKHQNNTRSNIQNKHEKQKTKTNSFLILSKTSKKSTNCDVKLINLFNVQTTDRIIFHISFKRILAQRHHSSFPSIAFLQIADHSTSAKIRMFNHVSFEVMTQRTSLDAIHHHHMAVRQYKIVHILGSIQLTMTFIHIDWKYPLIVDDDWMILRNQ